MNETTLIKVVSIMRRLSPCPPDQILTSTRLLDDLGIDSLKIAELSILLEDEFGVSVFLPDLLTAVTDPHELDVGVLTGFVQSQIDGGQG